MSSHALRTPLLLALALGLCLALSAAAQQPPAEQAAVSEPAEPGALEAAPPEAEPEAAPEAAPEAEPTENEVEIVNPEGLEGELVGEGEQAVEGELIGEGEHSADLAVEGEQAAEHAGHGEHAAGLTKTDYINFSTAVLSMALFVWIIIRFARKPLAQYLTDRSEAVRLAIDKAEQARNEALALQRQWQERLNNLEAESDQLMAAARRRAEDERQRIISEAERSAGKIVNDAKASIEIETEEAARRLRTDLAERALALALDQLKQRSDANVHQRFVAGAIAQIEEKP